MSLNTNLFKTSNFRIQFKNATNVEFQVIDTAIPAITLGTHAIHRPTITDKRPGDHIEFDDLNITLICDEDLLAYQQIYTQLISTVDPDYGIMDPISNVFDATLFLTTNKNNLQHKILFKNAFFKQLGSLNLSTTTSNENHISFTSVIGYSFFDFV